MNNDITIQNDYQGLVEDWLKAESEGERFPVPFDIAWQIAGYSTKGKGKRRLTSKRSHLIEGQDYLIEKGDYNQNVFAQSGKSVISGRSSDLILLTNDAFKHFCLIAETEQGRQIRQYFIECEKKWRLVEQYRPEVAEEIEILKLQNEGLRLQAEVNQSSLALHQFRHLITTTCPEPIQQKVLGYQTVEKIEYRDRVIKDDEILDNIGGYGISAIQKRYGFKSTKQAWAWLESFGYGKDSEHWDKGIYIREGAKLSYAAIAHLDELYAGSNCRQMYLGE